MLLGHVLFIYCGTCIKFSYYSFTASGICSDISLFIPEIDNMCLLSFIPVQSHQRFIELLKGADFCFIGFSLLLLLLFFGFLLH